MLQSERPYLINVVSKWEKLYPALTTTGFQYFLSNFLAINPSWCCRLCRKSPPKASSPLSLYASKGAPQTPLYKPTLC